MSNIKLLYIDLFCGAGGTSTGVEKAKYKGEKCAKVIACVNHDANAIASHAANHPDALHFTEDIRILDLSQLVAHIEKMKAAYPEALIVLHASLECTNFSKAKGGKPRDADSRTLAEHLFRYIEDINPDYIQIENVEEFMCWGDLDENGKPISKDNGRKYLQWVKQVKQYGYTFKHRILNAANYGAYTSRKRFFGIFAKNGLPITFPKPAYSKTGSESLFGNTRKWKPVKDVLDFSDEGESIFTRKKPLSDRTLERIYAGLIKFVAGGKDKWILKYNSINGATGKHVPPSIDEPCPVVSCQNRLGVVQTKFLSKYYGGHPESKNFSVEEPAHTVTPIDHHALINASFIQQRNTGNPKSKVFSVYQPARTVTATGGNQELVQAQFIGRYNGQPNQEINAVSIEAPAPTLTVKDRLSLVSPHYLMNPQYLSTGGSVENPCFTIIARMDKKPPYLISTETGQIAIEVYETDTEPMRRIKAFMALYGIVDIKMRMLKIPELKRIMGFPEDYTLIGTQAELKKYIGNAVEVNMSRVLCEALVKELKQFQN
ncbi:MAG: DNA cytosine methyltransferase [Dysgonamonadaceae bacterium]|jgi:DNA (cytosine-5)-methyltransferase 1|nr:DNA cytosine methyltransferase [Dysgonamonadaceae bacterium]